MTDEQPGLDMLTIEILEPPRPQQQTRFLHQRGRYFGSDPSKAYKQYLIWQIRPHAPKEPWQGPVKLNLTFILPIPKSNCSKVMRAQMLNGKVLPVKRPDLDNLAYIVTNAMKELIYEDDNQVVEMTIAKRYGEIPKTVIQVHVL